MWEIERTEVFLKWISGLGDDAKEAILAHLIVLKEKGPLLGRPYADSIKESKITNLKELRVQNKNRVFRIFFVFLENRKALLLIGGDKRGSKDFYSKMIKQAEKLYYEYTHKSEA